MPSFKRMQGVQAPSRRPSSNMLCKTSSSPLSSEKSDQCSEPDRSQHDIHFIQKQMTILNSDEDHINMAVTNLNHALKANGVYLERDYKDKLDVMFSTFRKLSMDPKLDFISRLELLELIELRAGEWVVKSSYYGKKLAKLERPDKVQGEAESNPIAPMPNTKFAKSPVGQSVQNWLQSIDHHSNRGRDSHGDNIKNTDPSEKYKTVVGESKGINCHSNGGRESHGVNTRNTYPSEELKTAVGESKSQDGGSHSGLSPVEGEFCHGVCEEEFLKHYSRHDVLIQETLCFSLKQAKSIFGMKGESVVDIMKETHAYIKFISPGDNAVQSIEVKGNRQSVSKAKLLLAKRARNSKLTKEPHTSVTQVGLPFDLPNKNQVSPQESNQQINIWTKTQTEHHEEKKRKRQESWEMQEELKTEDFQLKEVTENFHLFELPTEAFDKISSDDLKDLLTLVSKRFNCTLTWLSINVSTDTNIDRFSSGGYVAVKNIPGKDEDIDKIITELLSKALYKMANVKNKNIPNSEGMIQIVEDLIRNVSVDHLQDQMECDKLKERRDEYRHGGGDVDGTEDWSNSIDNDVKPHVWKPPKPFLFTGDEYDKTFQQQLSQSKRQRKKKVPSWKGPSRLADSNICLQPDNIVMSNPVSSGLVEPMQFKKSNLDYFKTQKQSTVGGAMLSKDFTYTVPKDFTSTLPAKHAALPTVSVNHVEKRNQEQTCCEVLSKCEINDDKNKDGRSDFWTTNSSSFPHENTSTSHNGILDQKNIHFHQKDGILDQKNTQFHHKDGILDQKNTQSHHKDGTLDQKNTQSRIYSERPTIDKDLKKMRKASFLRQPLGPERFTINTTQINTVMMCNLQMKKSASARRTLFALTNSKKGGSLTETQNCESSAHQILKSRNVDEPLKYSREEILEIGKFAVLQESTALLSEDVYVQALLVPKGWFDPVKYIAVTKRWPFRPSLTGNSGAQRQQETY